MSTLQTVVAILRREVFWGLPARRSQKAERKAKLHTRTSRQNLSSIPPRFLKEYPRRFASLVLHVGQYMDGTYCDDAQEPFSELSEVLFNDIKVLLSM
jgi:hypothetical protein